MKIYTKTGDKGTTSLIGGTRVSKADVRIDAYGTVDELNAYLGVVRDSISDARGRVELLQIQHVLFVIGSHLACEKESAKVKLPVLDHNEITFLENSIDQMNESLQPMTHFILPGGHLAISFCHVARTICRRSERNIVALLQDSTQDEFIIAYINRLADYLFVLARYIAYQNDVAEIKWIPKKS
jgi:cob(I)alamin adenosyltransferase